MNFSKKHLSSTVFSCLVWGAGLFVLVLQLAIMTEMFLGGWKAFSTFGFHFLIDRSWNPVKQVFGAAAPLFGTLMTSIIALVIALPFAFGCAFWLSQLAPPKMKKIVGHAIQLLAAIPSIIFGMWGFFIVVPFMARVVQPYGKTFFKDIPPLEWLVQGPPFGTGLLTAGIILAIMITPFICAILQDAFANTPTNLIESAYSLGATKWEIVRHIILPWSFRPLIGGIILGLGRALGETMAVTFVIGNANRIGWSLFSPSNTIASLIALEFPESPAGSLKLSALLALGFILMVISFFTLSYSRFLLKRFS
ncbi:phosphate ABC transporter permease subunit PstC [Entomobacter blattae]|uniref:Phosphate transport system permease protein n=1 Tax=Entomobacter blattae TaxID=2762277 RepID=A0A7H1NNV9_9PROT|nr:phosphate ABC transporter permease subunit PstC [Entomobacter blattae]QNT77469.1 Phosphate transport system permease protein PstC [Entomobacter blattae]